MLKHTEYKQDTNNLPRSGFQALLTSLPEKQQVTSDALNNLDVLHTKLSDALYHRSASSDLYNNTALTVK